MTLAAERLRRRIPSQIVAQLRGAQLLVLATASAEGVPATTLISWLYAANNHKIVLALDRRGLAYENVVVNPYGALEILLPTFLATARGSISMLCDGLKRAPFPCAAVLFSVSELRNHSAAGVLVRPAAYEFAPEKQQYGAVERTIVDELRRLADMHQLHG